jgi:hypothetical protein
VVCWHRRYRLGDEQPECDPNEYLERLACEHDARLRKWADLRESALRRYCERDGTMLRIERVYQSHLKRVLDEHFILLPLYLYDHSGISISTGKFSCPWDSGRVGFIYCSKETARKEWGPQFYPGISEAEIMKKAEAYLDGEVETYDAYLRGDVVGYIATDPDGEQIDSCWGFYPDEKGDWPDAIEQARDEIDAWAESQEKEATEAAYWAARDVETVAK